MEHLFGKKNGKNWKSKFAGKNGKIQFWKNIEHKETPILEKTFRKKTGIRGCRKKLAKYTSGKNMLEKIDKHKAQKKIAKLQFGKKHPGKNGEQKAQEKK